MWAIIFVHTFMNLAWCKSLNRSVAMIAFWCVSQPRLSSLCLVACCARAVTNYFACRRVTHTNFKGLGKVWLFELRRRKPLAVYLTVVWSAIKPWSPQSMSWMSRNSPLCVKKPQSAIDYTATSLLWVYWSLSLGTSTSLLCQCAPWEVHLSSWWGQLY